MKQLKFLAGILLVSGLALAGTIVDKTPDQGPFWHPLNGSPNGTYIYANSFIFSGSAGTQATVLGVYLQRDGDPGPGTPFLFELLGDNNDAPNAADVLGTTALLSASNTELQLITNALLAPVTLVPGSRYWVAASALGQTSVGAYQVGGHTQGSDGGTFWYSNDSTGQSWDGSGMTPEMAIFVSGNDGTEVPEPATLSLIGVGLAALILRRR